MIFGPEVRCDLSRLLTRKITKRIHSSKSASLNRPYWCDTLTGPKAYRAVCVITGFQVRSRGGRWSWAVSPEEIMSREVELGCESWSSFASGSSSTAVQRTLSLWLCPSTAVETAIAQCTSRCAMARGHRLNTSIVLAAVHGLSGLFRAVSAVEPSAALSFHLPPTPTPSPSLISHLASVDVKQNGLTQRTQSWIERQRTRGEHSMF